MFEVFRIQLFDLLRYKTLRGADVGRWGLRNRQTDILHMVSDDHNVAKNMGVELEKVLQQEKAA